MIGFHPASIALILCLFWLRAVTVFYAGNDASAKEAVHELAEDLGFDPVDAGGFSQGHALEVLTSLWRALAYGRKMGRGVAFRLMRRDG